MYQFSVDTEAVASFKLTGSYDVSLSLNGPSSTCPTAPSLACQAVPIPFAGIGAEVAGQRLAPGTYWVWADGADGGGTYSLSGSVMPILDPLGESCASPVALTFSGNTATATGSTRGRVNDTRTRNCGGGRPDVVYSFSLPSAGTITAAVTSQTTRYTPVVYVRSDCSGAELACVNRGTLSVALDAGAYFLWVDGVLDGVDGDFSLTLTS